tara:strand:+ start:14859 stop:15110 length:252 start_codon:yes stop_codon:yes gene_type:complete
MPDFNDSILITKRFRSPTEFSLFIEQRVSIEKIGYMDAVIDYCIINDVDIDNIGGLITPSLKQKIQIEAEDSNMMKPKGKLPI